MLVVLTLTHVLYSCLNFEPGPPYIQNNLGVDQLFLVIMWFIRLLFKDDVEVECRQRRFRLYLNV